MLVRLCASVIALASLLALPAHAAEPAAAVPAPAPSSWSGYVTPVVVGGALGAVAVPYLYPVVAPAVGGALVTTGGAIQTAAPAVGALALDTAAAAGGYAAGAAQSANGYLLAQSTQAQTAIGVALGAMAGWLYAPR